VIWECPMCGKRYDGRGLPPLSMAPTCSNSKRHKQTRMVVRDEYQCLLDDLGIPDDDPLRFAE
jgi:hypothetical protein